MRHILVKLSVYLWIYLLAGIAAAYSPILSWDVCSPSRIIVTLSGGADGGIIYIKGYGAACKQVTYNVSTRHEFEFDSCGIVAETYFTIIVQKNPLYQKGTDLQESLLCIYDLSDITVGNGINVGDKDDDAGLNKTVKPTAQMKLYQDGKDISGSDVKLTDLVTMTIQLDDEYIEDFDIKATSCTANFLDIVQDNCAQDGELFPNFLHAAQGAITASFGAFRTTELSGGYVEMTFSCTLQVCRGLCSRSSCSDGGEGWGRRKRKRAIENDAYDDLNVGASLSVGTDVDITATSTPTPDDNFCMNNLAFIVGLMVILAILMTSMGLTSYVTSRLVKKTDELQKVTGMGLNDKSNQQNSLTKASNRQTTSVTDIQTNSISNEPIVTKNEISNEQKADEDINYKYRQQEINIERLKPVLQTQTSASILHSKLTVNLQNNKANPFITGTGNETTIPTRNMSLNVRTNQSDSVVGQMAISANNSQAFQLAATLSKMNQQQIKQTVSNLAAQKQILQYKTMLNTIGSPPKLIHRS